MPRTMVSSGTPDDPCSTRGTGTAACSRAMSSRSSAALRSVMACDEPTATASASTPVSATNRAASSGSVRTPGACAPSLPPISPSSASTSTPARAARSTTRRVVATFSAKSSFAPSYITEPKPRSIASSASSGSSAWSRCTATAALDASATASVARAIGSKPPWYRTQFSDSCRMTGSPASSAAPTSASAVSRCSTLNAPTPVRAAAAASRIVRVAVSVMRIPGVRGW